MFRWVGSVLPSSREERGTIRPGTKLTVLLLVEGLVWWSMAMCVYVTVCHNQCKIVCQCVCVCVCVCVLDGNRACLFFLSMSSIGRQLGTNVFFQRHQRGDGL